jgi:ABC-type bacteriocin/lantibiotic exporter with double-glycine peptidase domain
VSFCAQKGIRMSRWVPSEMRWLGWRIRPFFWWHLASFLCITAGSLLSLLTPFVLKWLIDSVLPHKSVRLLLVAVGLIFLGHQGRTSLVSVGTYWMLHAAQKLGLNLRLELLRHLDTLSADHYETTMVGAVMYPFKDPIDEISYWGSDLLPAILRILVTTCFTLIAMLVLSPALMLAILPLAPIFLATRQHFRRQMAERSDISQLDRIAWSSFLEEHLSYLIPIQLLGRQTRQERDAFRLLARAVRSQQAWFRTSTCYTVCSSLAVVMALCTVVAYGGVRALGGSLSTGNLVAFYGLAAQLFDPLASAADLYGRTQRAFASIRQVQNSLSLRPGVTNVNRPIVIARTRPLEVEFINVEFRYPGQSNGLCIPSLRFLPGETIAIAGENGAGKSTLAKLIPRFYDPQHGLIRLANEDIRNLELRSLRRHVCYLSPSPVLFEGTLASNLAFVRPGISEDELCQALERVGLGDFIAQFPGGIRQRVGPRGCQLSGGQCQRLALARALLLDPAVLILDEATSCLDAASELRVLGRVHAELSASTMIVISHRPATLASFERLLLLSRGRIISDGKPRSGAGSTESSVCISTIPSVN